MRVLVQPHEGIINKCVSLCHTPYNLCSLSERKHNIHHEVKQTKTS